MGRSSRFCYSKVLSFLICGEIGLNVSFICGNFAQFPSNSSHFHIIDFIYGVIGFSISFICGENREICGIIRLESPNFEEYSGVMLSHAAILCCTS